MNGGKKPTDKAAGVRTPWGIGAELALEKLHPGLGLGAREVHRSQRARLMGAMVAVVANRGYPASSVAQVIALAGVSRASFYEHFNDKRDCFVETLKATLAGGVTIAEAAYGDEGNWEARAQRGLRGFLEAVAEQPAAAHLCMVDAYAAGASALAPLEETAARLVEVGLEAMRALEGRAGTPPELARAVIGGLRAVVYRQLALGRQRALVERAERLFEWAIAHPPPPGPLQARWAEGEKAELPRAPLAAHIPSERILRGFAEAVAESGYVEVTIAEIAAAARVSQATFYAHFAGKEEAMAAALEASGAQLVAAALPAMRRSRDWPEALRAAIRMSFAFYAAEPAFARLRALEAAAAGPWAVAQRDRSWEQLADLVAALGFAERPALDRLELEASIGALNAILHERISEQGPEGVEEAVALATYVVAVPYAGPEEALRAASEPR